MPEEQSLDDYQAAFKKLNRLVLARDRSIAESRQRLVSDGFSEMVIDKVIARACECEILDDQRFIRAYVSGKQHLGWGIRKIEAGLKKHEIRLQLQPGYPDSHYNAEDELNRALKCLTSSRSKAKDQRSAQFRRLLAKGFSADIAQKAISQLTLVEQGDTI